jgi:hypothetical protein
MNCPFCGVSTDVAHETQEACIEALNAEIKRVREILHHVRSAEVPGLRSVDKKDEADKPARGPTEV